MNKFHYIYYDIADKIKQDIFPIGNLLPSENELAKSYQVSRETIRRALQLLSENGFIAKKHGLGSIVLDYRRFALPISGLISYKELKQEQGIVSQTDIIENKLISTPKFLQELLNISSDKEFIYLVRSRSYNNEIIIIDEDYLLTDYIPEIPPQVARDSIYEYFEKTLKLEIGYAMKEFTAEKAGSLDVQLMQLNPSEYTIVVRSQVFLSDARFFQYTISHHRIDRFRFQEFAPRNKFIAK